MTVKLDPDDLERLLRGYHYQVSDMGMELDDFWPCACGFQPSMGHPHSSHVDHCVRQALQGQVIL